MVPFYKMSGCGNDFIAIDNRNLLVKEDFLGDFAKKVCLRKISAGADGILYLEKSVKADFKMRLFSPDGSEAEMCGNGTRCIARFAFLEGIVNNRDIIIETLAGMISVKIVGAEVESKMLDVILEDIEVDKIIRIDGIEYKYHYVCLGVPHCILFLKQDFTEKQLQELGRKIRFSMQIFPEGTNVNFVAANSNNSLFVKTYERGMEDITLACGTGSTASVIIAAYKGTVKSPVRVETKGGGLIMEFEKVDNSFKNVFLSGDAKVL